MRTPSKNKLFLRYLLITLYFIVPLVLRAILYFLIGLIVTFLASLSFKAIVILILLGIVSIGVGIWIIMLMYTGISFLGYKIMQLTPNKTVFWVMFVLSCLQILDTLIGYTSATNMEILMLPAWGDVLLSLFVLVCYGIGGFTRSEEEDSQIAHSEVEYLRLPNDK